MAAVDSSDTKKFFFLPPTAARLCVCAGGGRGEVLPLCCHALRKPMAHRASCCTYTEWPIGGGITPEIIIIIRIIIFTGCY